MPPDVNQTRRFAIALSFPGEHRRLVRNVAKRLAEEFKQERVFFDEWDQSELHGTDAELKLRQIYRDDSELVVPFFSEHYKGTWCQIEWRAIRAVLADRSKDNAVVPVRIDGTRIEGWEDIDLGIRKGRSRTHTRHATGLADRGNPAFGRVFYVRSPQCGAS
jgi:hypothetical protein